MILCAATSHLSDYAGMRVENEALLLTIPQNSLEETTLNFKSFPFALSDLEAIWDGNPDHLVLKDFSACIGKIPIKGRLEYGFLENPADWFLRLQILEWGGNLLDLQSVWNEVCTLPLQIQEGFFIPRNGGVEIEVYARNGVREQFLRIEGTISDATLDWMMGGIQIGDVHGEIVLDQKRQELCLSQVQASFLCGKKRKEYLLWMDKIRFYGPYLEEVEFQIALLQNKTELFNLKGRVEHSDNTLEKFVVLDLLHSSFLQRNFSSFSMYLHPKDQAWHLDFSVLPDIGACKATYKGSKIEIEQLRFREMELFGEIESYEMGWKSPSLGIAIPPYLLLGLTGEWHPGEEQASGSIKYSTLHLDTCPLLQELPCKGVVCGSGDFTFCYQHHPKLSLRLDIPISKSISGEVECVITPHRNGWKIVDCSWKSQIGGFFSPEIQLEPFDKSFLLSCLHAECTNWRLNIGKSAGWSTDLSIPKVYLNNYSAHLDNLCTWQGEGSLLFRNPFLENGGQESIPAWFPTQGEIFYRIENKKIWLTRLKDSVNKNHSIKIVLASTERSWLDFTGRLAIWLRVKPHNPLLRAFEPLSIFLNGNVEHVQCVTQVSKKQRILPKTFKKSHKTVEKFLLR